MLHNSQEDLCRCWDAINTMLKLQLGAIRTLFQKKVLSILSIDETLCFTRCCMTLSQYSVSNTLRMG